MHAPDKLKDTLHQRWAERMERIKAANRDFGDRLIDEQLIFDFDVEDDSLSVSIGERPAFAYTQGDEHMYVDVDDADHIVAITVNEFTKYLQTHPALSDLAAALRHLGRIEVPAGNRSDEVTRELRGLIPA